MLVTHDRYLLDRVSTEILALDGAGGAHALADYAQWERVWAAPNAPASAPAAKPKSQAQNAAPAAPRRLTTAEQRELTGMEEAIEAAEQEASRHHDRLADPAIAADHVAARDALQAFEAAPGARRRALPPLGRARVAARPLAFERVLLSIISSKRLSRSIHRP